MQLFKQIILSNGLVIRDSVCLKQGKQIMLMEYSVAIQSVQCINRNLPDLEFPSVRCTICTCSGFYLFLLARHCSVYLLCRYQLLVCYVHSVCSGAALKYEVSASWSWLTINILISESGKKHGNNIIGTRELFYDFVKTKQQFSCLLKGQSIACFA